MLIDFLAKLLLVITYCLLLNILNILFIPSNFQNGLNAIKIQKCNLEHQILPCMLLGSIWESTMPFCMNYRFWLDLRK